MANIIMQVSRTDSVSDSRSTLIPERNVNYDDLAEPIHFEPSEKVKELLRKHIIFKFRRMRRKNLIDRLKLEAELCSGVIILTLYVLLFGLVIGSMMIEVVSEQEYGVKTTYEEILGLPDIVDLGTPAELASYLGDLSDRARELQPLSGHYFEAEGDMRITTGIRHLKSAVELDVDSIKPRIDSPSFTFTAWVELEPGHDGFVIRKPVPGSSSSSYLNCWGWYLGDKGPQFYFGGHDFGLGLHDNQQEEVVSPDIHDYHRNAHWHLEAVSVNETHMVFYQDGHEIAYTRIDRPVTDCEGNRLLIGAKDMYLADLTFFPRQLTTHEIEEIMFSGFTFENVVNGRVPTDPVITEFDTVKINQGASAAKLEELIQNLSKQRQIDEVQTRSLLRGVSASYAHASLLVVNNQSCQHAWPTCKVIEGVNQTWAVDPITNKYYVDLLPSAHGHRVYLNHASEGEWIHYDANTFPYWKGKSMTFTGWVKAHHGGYLISKHLHHDDSLRCWTIDVREDYLGTLGGVDIDGFHHPSARVHIPSNVSAAFESMKTLRHVAIVFDADSNSVSAYLDGEKFGEETFEYQDAIKKLDCWNASGGTYIGLGHRASGAVPFTGEVQDLRMYIGSALSASEIREIAFESAVPRECKLKNESMDTSWTDMNDHTCAWYKDQLADAPNICSSDEVRENCPIACSLQETCYQGPADAHELGKAEKLWNRVMKVPPTGKSEHNSVICVSASVDAVSECRTLMANHDPRSYPDHHDAPALNSFHHLLELSSSTALYYKAVTNVTDCDVLEKSINSYCSFSTTTMKPVAPAIVASQEFTISFWIRGTGEASLQEGAMTPVVVFYNDLAPPKPLISILTRRGGSLYIAVWAGCGDDSMEDINFSARLSADKWTHISIVFGLHDARGRKLVGAMVNSLWGEDSINFDWCLHENEDLIQAVEISNEFLMSPIEVRPFALSTKELQVWYYEQYPKFEPIIGPVVYDKDRIEDRIEIHKLPYRNSVILLAPPIILQSKTTKTTECPNKLGTHHAEEIWHLVHDGSTCHSPYECPKAVKQSSVSLAICHDHHQPDTFFGRSSIEHAGKHQFVEFLMSVVDASVLVRDGEVLETTEFIDASTKELQVILAGFAPQYGISSKVLITIKFGSRMTVDYDIEHFQSVENGTLKAYRTMVILAFFVLGLILVWAVADAIDKGFAVHTVLEVSIIAVYVGYLISRLVVNIQSQEDSLHSSGEFDSVPWQDAVLHADDKMEIFLESLHKFESKLAEETRFHIVSCFVSFLIMLRIIATTASHPRTNLLVGTVTRSLQGLWHWGLLLSVLFIGSAFMFSSRFGNHYQEFQSLETSFITLFSMMRGRIPASLGEEPLISVFLVGLNFVFSMLMMNFLIAILIDAYIKMKADTNRSEVHQEFFTDCGASISSWFLHLYYRWPRHEDVIKNLEQCVKFNVGRNYLTTAFPEWNQDSLDAFIRWYRRFDFIQPQPFKRDQIDMTEEIVKSVAALMGRRMPSAQEKLHVEVAAMPRSPMASLKKRSMGQEDKAAPPAVFDRGLPVHHAAENPMPAMNGSKDGTPPSPTTPIGSALPQNGKPADEPNAKPVPGLVSFADHASINELQNRESVEDYVVQADLGFMPEYHGMHSNGLEDSQNQDVMVRTPSSAKRKERNRPRSDKKQPFQYSPHERVPSPRDAAASRQSGRPVRSILGVASGRTVSQQNRVQPPDIFPDSQAIVYPAPEAFQRAPTLNLLPDPPSHGNASDLEDQYGYC